MRFIRRPTYSLLICLTALASLVGCGETSDTKTSSVSPSSNDSSTSVPEPEISEPDLTANTTSTPPAEPTTDAPAAKDKPIPKSDAVTTVKPKESSSTSSGNEPWGHQSGRFVVSGDTPTPTKLTVTKDQAFCGKNDLLDESLIVNKKNGGLANVVVYLYLKRGTEAPEAHPSYIESATAKVSLDNDKCRFEPHVCLVRTGQTLVVGNKDTVGHNTKVDTTNNTAINPITPAGQSFEHQFEREERTAVPVSCSIHPWMSGWLLIRDNPYFAATDADGSFEIKNLPPGKWTFQLWHERAGFVSEATVNGKKTKWSRGRMEVTIKPSETNNLGKIEVAAAKFQR